MNPGTIPVLEDCDEDFETVPDAVRLAGVTNDFRRDHTREVLNLPSN
jgi:hypothetical protein